MSEEIKYELVVGKDACEMCISMAGVYDYPPAVPLHPNCRCKVVKKGDKGDVRYEIRNLQADIDNYTGMKVAGEYDNPEEESVEATVELGCGIELASFDEGVQEELGWNPGGGTVSASVTLPPKSSGEIIMEIEYEQIVCRGERWEIYESQDPVAGFDYQERYVGEVGGMGIAVVDLLGVYVR